MNKPRNRQLLNEYSEDYLYPLDKNAENDMRNRNLKRKVKRNRQDREESRDIENYEYNYSPIQETYYYSDIGNDEKLNPRPVNVRKRLKNRALTDKGSRTENQYQKNLPNQAIDNDDNDDNRQISNTLNKHEFGPLNQNMTENEKPISDSGSTKITSNIDKTAKDNKQYVNDDGEAMNRLSKANRMGNVEQNIK